MGEEKNRTRLLGGLIILILLVAIVFVAPIIPITVQETYQDIEEYQDQEPYSVQESYTEQEPYDVEESYTVEVDVTRTEEVVDYYLPLGFFVFEATEVVLPVTTEYDVSWRSSMNDVILFGVMTDEAYNSFYNSIVMAIGLPALATILSGGILAPLTVPVLTRALPSLLTVVSSESYYAVKKRLLPENTDDIIVPLTDFDITAVTIN